MADALRDLDFDAYFPDERGAKYLRGPKAGLSINRFTRLFARGPRGQPEVELSHAEAARRGIDLSNKHVVRLRAETYATSLLNPLDAANGTALVPKLPYPQAIPRQAAGQARAYPAYVPAGWVAQARATKRLPGPVDVVLWFGVGSELVRHGLRTALERVGVARPTAFILIPGVEPQHDDAFGHRWGVGITERQVHEVLDGCFATTGLRIEARVTAMYVFSTGWMGFTGTVRNELLPLSTVERLVIVDCLTATGGMPQAIEKLTAATRKQVRILTYAASTGGTAGIASRRLAVPVPEKGISWLGLHDSRHAHAFQVLTHARTLSGGLDDGIVKWSDLDPTRHDAFRALFRALPPRGTVVSDPGVYAYIHGSVPTGVATLDSWWAGVERVGRVFLESLFADRPGFPALTRLIWTHSLPGWTGRSDKTDAMSPRIKPAGLVEGQHDFIPFEFFWEGLR